MIETKLKVDNYEGMSLEFFIKEYSAKVRCDSFMVIEMIPVSDFIKWLKDNNLIKLGDLNGNLS